LDFLLINASKACFFLIYHRRKNEKFQGRDAVSNAAADVGIRAIAEPKTGAGRSASNRAPA